MTPTIIGQIVAGVVGLVTLWLREYYSEAAVTRRMRDALQVGRNKIVDGDADAVAVRIDGLLVGSDGSSSGIQSDADTAKRINDLLGKGVVPE